MRAHNFVAALLCTCTMSAAALAQTPAKNAPKPQLPTPSGTTTGPKEPDPWAGKTDLFIPPNLQPTTKVNVGQVSRSTTTNGMLLITVPRHTVASVDVTLALRIPDTAE